MRSPGDLFPWQIYSRGRAAAPDGVGRGEGAIAVTLGVAQLARAATPGSRAEVVAVRVARSIRFEGGTARGRRRGCP